MISERTFSGGFSGFWAECMPLLTPHLVSEFNLMGSRFAYSTNPLDKLYASGKSLNHDVIAEVAFELFVTSLDRLETVIELARDEGLIQQVTTNARARISKLAGHHAALIRDMELQLKIAIELAKRLEKYFNKHEEGRAIIVQPRFKGCGLLDSCYGDILVSPTLYESKMVDRNLRGVDLRQLLTYCALNYRSKQYLIENIAVINARRGIVYEFELEYLSRRVSGKTAPELLRQIADFLFSFDDIHAVL